MNTLNSAPLIARLHGLHTLLRDAVHAHVVEQSKAQRLDHMAAACIFQGGDTVYNLDMEAEKILVPYCDAWGQETPFLLIAEGLPPMPDLNEGEHLCGCETREEAQFVLICDPIDGTRPLMYDKRSAWLLTAIAPNVPNASMLDVEIAMQSELPTSRALLADRLWAVRGQGVEAFTENLMTRENEPFVPRPSQSPTIAGGFACFCKFFPGSKAWLAELEERLVVAALGPPPGGQPQTFDDQYISNGGQLYDLMTGRDRFNAEFRPLAHERKATAMMLFSHPYDLCCELIAREAGVIVTNMTGGPLDYPLDVNTPVGWIGYANEAIRNEIEPHLMRLLYDG